MHQIFWQDQTHAQSMCYHRNTWAGSEASHCPKAHPMWSARIVEKEREKESVYLWNFSCVLHTQYLWYSHNEVINTRFSWQFLGTSIKLCDDLWNALSSLWFLIEMAYRQMKCTEHAKQIKNDPESFVKGHLRSSLISAREFCVGVTEILPTFA